MKEITINGKLYTTLAEAAAALGVSEDDMHKRYARLSKSPTQFEIDSVMTGKQGVVTENITVEGKTYRSVHEAANHYPPSYATISRRLAKLGPKPSALDIDRCFTIPARKKLNSNSPIIICGRAFGSLSEAAQHYNLKVTLVASRLRTLGDKPPQSKIDACFTTPVTVRKRLRQEITVAGIKYKSLSAAIEKLGVNESTVYTRLAKLGDEPTSEEIDACFSKARHPAKRASPAEDKKYQPITVEKVKYDGLSQACAAYNLSYSTVYHRLKALDELTTEKINECFTRKHQEKHNRRPIIIDNNKFSSIRDAAEHYGVKYSTVSARLNKLYKKTSNPSDEDVKVCFTQGYLQKIITVHGRKFTSVKEAALEYGVRVNLVRKRLNHLDNPTPEEINNCFYRKKSVHDPITVNGIDFDNFEKAANHYRISVLTAYKRYSELFYPTEEQINECFIHNGVLPIPITVHGTEYPSIKAACAKYGITQTTVCRRLNKLHEPNADEINECFTREVRNPHATPVTVQGTTFSSLNEASNHYGVSPSKISRRLRRMENPTQTKIDALFTKEAHTNARLKPITVQGVTYPTVSAAAEAYGLDMQLVSNRMFKLDEKTPEKIDECFTTSVREKSVAIVVNGIEFKNITMACREYDVTKSVLLRKARNLLKERHNISVKNLSEAFDKLTSEEINECFLKTPEAEPLIVFGEEFKTINAAARRFGVPSTTARFRYNRLTSKTPENINRCFMKEK